MKHRARTPQLVWGGLLALLLTSGPGFAEDPRGSVVDVSGLDVWIRVDAPDGVRPGDMVDIRFAIPGGEELSIGSWRVVEVEGGLVFAEVVSNTGRPAVGQTAVVRATGAGSPPAQPRWEASRLPGPEPAARAEPSGSRQGEDWRSLPYEIRQHLDALFEGDARAVRVAAKQLYRHYRDEPAVQQAAERALLEGYRRDSGDPEHVDAMAWLCNILGVSGNPAFAATLEEVAAGAASPKLQKYAVKNLSRTR